MGNMLQVGKDGTHGARAKANTGYSQLGKFGQGRGRGTGQDNERTVDGMDEFSNGVGIAYANGEEAIRSGLPVDIHAQYALLEAIAGITDCKQNNSCAVIDHQRD